MRAIALDIDSPDAIRKFGQRLRDEAPGLNVLVNNAGIQRPENLGAQPDDLAEVAAMVTTNLLGPIRLSAAVLPHRRPGPPAITSVSTATSGGESASVASCKPLEAITGKPSGATA